jgi:hypothetical protein
VLHRTDFNDAGLASVAATTPRLNRAAAAKPRRRRVRVAAPPPTENHHANPALRRRPCPRRRRACARGQLIDLAVVDRDSGQTLPTYTSGGKLYVAGTPGHRYSVRLTNRSGSRVLAVLSVDGVNAVSGQTANPDQTGYVLDAWQSTEIAGWRKTSTKSRNSISPPCRTATPRAPDGPRTSA